MWNHTPPDDFQSSITDIVRTGVSKSESGRRFEERRGEYGEDLALGIICADTTKYQSLIHPNNE